MRYVQLFFLSLLLGWSGISCQPNMQSNSEIKAPAVFDWQGHRGTRGLMPENTIPAFLKALEFPEITTLELDVVVSADQQVVVSHEPWFSPNICRLPNGEKLPGKQEKDHNLYRLTYEEIAAVDCGSWKHSNFPEQSPVTAPKPLLVAVLDSVIAHCQQTGRHLPAFNIELKSKPAWDGVYTPGPESFIQLVLATLAPYQNQVKTCIQSFDPRILKEVHRQAPEQTTAYLAEKPVTINQIKHQTGYLPTIYSPFHVLVSANLVKTMHEAGMQVIPWTVNETATMQSLIQMGVDGIITDYPNRIPK